MPQTLLGNRILDAVPEIEAASFRPHLVATPMKAYDVIYAPKERIKNVYFPTTAVLSMITIMRNGSAVEIGTFGSEGLSGSQLVLGGERFPSQVICQVPGDAFRLSLDAFRSHLEKAPTFHRLVHQYVQALFNFMGQSIACNRLHSVNERCARWLLLTHDRVPGDAFKLTQEFLAIMLGVQRPVVSGAAYALQEAGYIRYRRGLVEILDRAGLASASCECYQINADGFNAIFKTV
jgi:CRP-like cAMP-binding protein